MRACGLLLLFIIMVQWSMHTWFTAIKLTQSVLPWRIINSIVKFEFEVRYRCKIIISYRKFQKCIRADNQKLIILLEWPYICMLYAYIRTCMYVHVLYVSIYNNVSIYIELSRTWDSGLDSWLSLRAVYACMHACIYDKILNVLRDPWLISPGGSR